MRILRRIDSISATIFVIAAGFWVAGDLRMAAWFGALGAIVTVASLLTTAHEDAERDRLHRVRRRLEETFHEQHLAAGEWVHRDCQRCQEIERIAR